MKSAWSLFSLLSWAIVSQAQTELQPGEEFRLVASSNTISLSRSQVDSVKLSVHRSKSFKMGEASLFMHEPKIGGLKAEIKQQQNRPDEFMLYFTASTDAQAGEYNLIPTCTLGNKKKGIVLKLIIQ